MTTSLRERANCDLFVGNVRSALGDYYDAEAGLVCSIALLAAEHDALRKRSALTAPASPPALEEWQPTPCPNCDGFCGDVGPTCSEVLGVCEDYPNCPNLSCGPRCNRDAASPVAVQPEDGDAVADMVEGPGEHRPSVIRWLAPLPPIGTKLYTRPVAAQQAVTGEETWFVSRSRGWPGGIDFRTQDVAIAHIREFGTDETGLHFWIHQANRKDYTREELAALLAQPPESATQEGQ